LLITHNAGATKDYRNLTATKAQEQQKGRRGATSYMQKFINQAFVKQGEHPGSSEGATNMNKTRSRSDFGYAKEQQSSALQYL
jgi:hypothetical protein